MITRCTHLQQTGWLTLRQALWSDSTQDQHLGEMAAMLSCPQRFVALTFSDPAGQVLGFAEASIRSEYVNGTQTSPVGFLEGLFVTPASRGQGVARALVAAVEQWSQALGCTELASDAALENQASHAMHQALGFAETERVVYFRKAID